MEIIFKVKHPISGKVVAYEQFTPACGWRYLLAHEIAEHGYDEAPMHAGVFTDTIDDFPRVPFTGQRDKNRQHIFEGDYLKDDKYIYQVEWTPNNTRFRLQKKERIITDTKQDKLDVLIDIIGPEDLGTGYSKREDLELCEYTPKPEANETN